MSPLKPASDDPSTVSAGATAPRSAAQRGAKSSGRALVRALRPHHWLKNVLIFLPVVFHHSFWDLAIWTRAGLAFALFCLATSAVYLLNDLYDVESDRKHPVKRHRPFASGQLNVQHGLLLAGLLIALSVGIGLLTLPIAFALTVLAYFTLNAFYTTWLKRKVMLDIVLLASFYAIRIIAGGAATEIIPSEWLLALSMFLFLSLAILKRHSELVRLRSEGVQRTDSRGYRVDDIPLLESMGVTSGYMAVLVLALYINSDQVVGLYSRPRLLWLICPLLLYWVSRTWIWGRRGVIAEDPLLFAIRDRMSWAVLVMIVVVAIASL